MSRILRPHHGMCIQFYEGKGYSKDFTDHMGRIVQEMKANPTQKVTLKVQTDIVCKNCPNNESGICTSQEKVTGYDKEVLKCCGLREGTEIGFDDFTALIRERIIHSGLRAEICGDCSWNDICSHAMDSKEL